MHKDLISYELAEGVTQEQLLKVAKQIVNDWMKQVPGFIKWEIHSGKDDRFTDIVTWESAEDAKHAEKDMMNIPNAAEWYGCYKEGSITSSSLATLAEF